MERSRAKARPPAAAKLNVIGLIDAGIIYLSIYLSVCLSVYLSVCLSIYLSICLSVCLSVCLSIYLSIYKYMYGVFSFLVGLRPTLQP